MAQDITEDGGIFNLLFIHVVDTKKDLYCIELGIDKMRFVLTSIHGEFSGRNIIAFVVLNNGSQEDIWT